MTKDEIKALQIKVGASPDGIWGALSIAACKQHLEHLEPKINPWPASTQEALEGFYGSAGDESELVNLDVSDCSVRYEGQLVSTIRCHNKVAESLGRIIAKLSNIPQGRAALKQYAGVFNNRPMRGGSLPSLHARGAAIDLDPDPNRNKQAWPTSATMPLEVMEVFAAEGWVCAGSAWGRDAMHFQATK
jgi:hypothetical protein